MYRTAAAELAKDEADPGTKLNGSAADTPELVNTASVCRTTAVFPLALNQNWEAFALKAGVSKNEILIAALKQYLLSQGMQPDRHPRLEVSY